MRSTTTSITNTAAAASISTAAATATTTSERKFFQRVLYQRFIQVLALEYTAGIFTEISLLAAI
jgi:hypothetical protein